MIKLKMKNYKTILQRSNKNISIIVNDKYEYLTGEEIFSSDQNRISEEVNFIYSQLGRAFEKTIKTIEEQWEKQIKSLEKHGKQLVKYSDQKESLAHSKQKEIF